MIDADILQLDLTDLSWRIAARQISSSETVRAALTRLEQLENKLNAFITVLRDQATVAAKQADEEIARGKYRGPLHGVPVTIKDMFETAGVRTTGGSKILADWIPNTDADLVEKLRAAGAIIIGKTNLDEFGHGGTSTLSHFGPVHNPWDVERIAGGSSGGSAAAVAAGIGPLSYGTETGSSVRRPASYCGIVGFKPTFGIISRHGSFRGAWSQDHVGLFARSVKDISLGLDAVAGYDPRDPASVQQDKPAYAFRLEAKIKGMKIGVPRRFLDSVTPAVKEAFDAALKVLADAGCEIVNIDIPELRYAAMTSNMTSSAESAGINRRWFRERHQDYVPHVARGIAVGMTITASEYLTVQRARQRIREAVRSAYERVAIIASPTTSRVAPLLSE
ncbi:MAG TPA: amidase, partial [Acidobacteriota bacterium]|nr:amidase [Acidobacteriota bacterium]